MDVTMDLEPIDAATTSLGYRAVVNIQGRLAILGEMVIRATAAVILEEFAKRLRTQLAATETRG
jgi:carbon monoxide dehydrogenase subunit G